MSDRKNLYIPSIDAKDLYLSNHFIKQSPYGYKLSKSNGEENIKKYINSFDYSLDLIELRQVAEQVFKKKDTLSFVVKGKEYSSKIINVTFKYAVKEFNEIVKDVYVREGYNINEYREKLVEGYVLDEDINGNTVLAAIKVNTPIYSDNIINEEYLPKRITIKKEKLCHTYVYDSSKPFATLLTAKELREWIYKEGFLLNGHKYCRFKRSSGSARVGKCLFIDERLYPLMHQSEICGLDIENGKQMDIAGFEAYIALPTSSIIDVISIEPKNILVIDDYESKFEEDSVCVDENEEHHLVTTEGMMKISNSIWDGQSLIDPSLMGEYSDKGMLLLRNKFFKSACFNTNIQQFFKDNGITDISQVQGKTIATNIEDIKLITTPSSIKYFKFGTYEDWLKNIYPIFGIVKYDKPTHYFDGRMVQAHYQLINTLQLTKDEMYQIVKNGIDYISALNTNPDVMRYHLKYTDDIDFKDTNVMPTKNDIVYTMLQYKCDFDKTKIYYDFKKDLCRSYIKNMKRGHVLVNGTYATLFGNPYEMLLQTIGKFDGTSVLNPGEIHNIRFEYGKELLGSRSPHVTIGNILITKNVACEVLDKYFNLTEHIVCLNSINENILERLSGADFDSDVALLTDNPIMISSAKKNYDFFKVPTRKVNPDKSKKHYTPEDLAELDYVTSVNKIGEIVNLSQELNSLLWDLVSKSECSVEEQYDYIKEIYLDVCQLDVMSNIEIDKAKKVYNLNNAKELNMLRDKYKDVLTSDDGRKRMPNFLGYIAQLKNYANPQRKDYTEYLTSMDYLVGLLSGNRSIKSKGSNFMPFSEIFKPIDFDKKAVKYDQVNKILDMARKTSSELKGLAATKTLDSSEFILRQQIIKENLLFDINRMKLNKHTMYVLLTKLELKENLSIKNLLFYLLFSYKNDILIDILKQYEFVNEFLDYDPNGKIDYYGISFSKKSSTFALLNA